MKMNSIFIVMSKQIYDYDETGKVVYGESISYRAFDNYKKATRMANSKNRNLSNFIFWVEECELFSENSK